MEDMRAIFESERSKFINDRERYISSIVLKLEQLNSELDSSMMIAEGGGHHIPDERFPEVIAAYAMQHLGFYLIQVYGEMDDGSFTYRYSDPMDPSRKQSFTYNIEFDFTLPAIEELLDEYREREPSFDEKEILSALSETDKLIFMNAYSVVYQEMMHEAKYLHFLSIPELKQWLVKVYAILSYCRYSNGNNVLRWERAARGCLEKFQCEKKQYTAKIFQTLNTQKDSLLEILKDQGEIFSQKSFLMRVRELAEEYRSLAALCDVNDSRAIECYDIAAILDVPENLLKNVYKAEVLNVPGGYMRKKLKERAPEKLQKMQELLNEKKKYTPGSLSISFLLYSIAMLLGGAIFCQAMMDGAPYSGLFGLYSAQEGLGLYHMAIFAWVICGLLYIGYFNILTAFIVAHIIIPLTFAFKYLPILHLIWPLVGLALTAFTLKCMWEDFKWNRAYNKVMKYYRENIESLEDDIWQEVEKKYGKLALRSEVKSIINYK